MTIHTETNNSDRLEYIDWAKGVMILLVIVGHIGDFYFEKASYMSLRIFIYSFHVPLFFLLSGYVMGITQQRLKAQSFKKWLWHKVQTLLIPFIVWGLFVYRFIDPICTSPLDLEALRQLVLNPDHGGAWFLISLFCIQFVCYPIFRYERVYAWLVPIAFVIVGLLLGGSFFYCNPHHYICFLAGYIFYKHQDYVYRTDVATAALLCFIIAEKVYPHPVLCTLSASTALLFVCRRISNVGGVIFVSRKI